MQAACTKGNVLYLLRPICIMITMSINIGSVRAGAVKIDVWGSN